ncbi:MAG TPA: M81 family metallopeptidase [Pirellulales bacterium]|jgi:microcystin degradation protein MlrC|nr:M81 family metallopeptidase [Pirellulales bacterium]
MRIAIGQLSQESNTFNPLPTTRNDFEQFGVVRGADVVSQMADTNELGGFIQSLRAWPEQPEIVGLVRLMAWPGGMATAETFQWLRDELLEPLRRSLPVDAVLLSLHGSLVAEEVPDVEGEVLRSVRAAVGPGVPIVATLDLHANVTALMAASADALVLFHTAPHIDVFETGQRGARVLRRILEEGAKRPFTYFRKLPMVVPAEAANTQDPASVSYGIRGRLEALEHSGDVLAAGLATVQPWLDIPELGTSVVVVSAGRSDLAVTHGRELADEVWRRRRDYLPELVSVETAVRSAHDRGEGLVVLSDSADATTSGAPGDSNWVLQELLKYTWPRPALVPLVAPNVVAAAEAADVGAELSMPLGGMRDAKYSQPIRVTARVERLFDARFIMSGHLAKNLPIDMGRSAVLAAGDVRILITSRSGPHFAPQFFQAAGFDPYSASVLVAKSPCGFRAAYQGRAREIMVVRAPGCAPSDFWNYDYRHIPRPLWPWDEIDAPLPTP